MIGRAIYRLLSSDSDVGALVGSRIYPLVAPQDQELPLIVYQVISTVRGYVHGGADGLVRQRVQLTLVADRVESAVAVADAVRRCMSGYSGQVDDLMIYLITLDTESDGIPTAESSLRVRRMDFTVHYLEV